MHSFEFNSYKTRKRTIRQRRRQHFICHSLFEALKTHNKYWPFIKIKFNQTSKRKKKYIWFMLLKAEGNYLKHSDNLYESSSQCLFKLQQYSHWALYHGKQRHTFSSMRHKWTTCGTGWRIQERGYRAALETFYLKNNILKVLWSN